MSLSKIKVLDLSRILAGPFCSMLLGDNGADIIKIENVKTGDDTRLWGPPFVDNNSLYFWSVNRNKKSVAINFQDIKGAELVQNLASQCDVVVENFIPGKLKKFGLDYETLQKRNNKLIYCSISGFGQNGPYSQRPGYDVIAAGMGGLLNITGPENGEPCRVGVAVTDILTGMFAYSSILSSIIGRLNNNQNEGCHIDCNLLATQVAMLFHIGANYLTANLESKRFGTGHSTIVPYQAFPTNDDKLFIVGAGNDKQFQVMLSKLELTAQLGNDSRFTTNSDRVVNRNVLIPLLTEEFKKKNLTDWLDIFNTTSLPHGPVNDLKCVFSNPQVQHMADYLINTWNVDGHRISVPGNPVQTRLANDDKPLKLASCHPPKLGQHTRQVLQQWLNMDDLLIKQLHNSGTILVR